MFQRSVSKLGSKQRHLVSFRGEVCPGLNYPLLPGYRMLEAFTIRFQSPGYGNYEIDADSITRMLKRGMKHRPGDIELYLGFAANESIDSSKDMVVVHTIKGDGDLLNPESKG